MATPIKTSETADRRAADKSPPTAPGNALSHGDAEPLLALRALGNRGLQAALGKAAADAPESTAQRQSGKPREPAARGDREALPAVESALQQPGRPLEPHVRVEMERRFGSDFSGVRLHTGARAEESAHSLGALAFTAGEHIVFGPGQFRPRVLAHELAHVLQQNGVARDPGRPLTVAAASGAHEADAHHAAASALMGQPTAVHVRTPLQIARLVREEDVQTLSDADLASEHELVRSWLTGHDAAEPAYAERRSYLDQLESEVARRNPSRAAGEVRREKLVGFLRKAPSIPGLPHPAMVAFLTEFGFGLKDGIALQPPERKQRLSARLLEIGLKGAFTSVDFAVGYGKGIFLGIWGEIKGLVDLVLLLPRLQMQANEWLLSQLFKNRDANALLLKGQALYKELTDLAGKAAEEIREFFRDPKKAMDKLSALYDEMLSKGLRKAYELGQGAVEQSFQFLEKPDEELGEELGKIAGMVLFQVVLLVATDAIGNLIAKGAGLAARIGRTVLEGAGKIFNGVKALVTELIGLLRTLGRTLLRAFEGTIEALMNVVRRVEAFFAELIELSAPERALAGGGKAPANVLMSEAKAVGTPTRTTMTTVEDLRPRFPEVKRGVPPPEAEIIEGPVSELQGPQKLSTSVSSLDSIQAAKEAGVPSVLTEDGTVLTRHDFADIVPDQPFRGGRPAPPPLAAEGRAVSLSQVQNTEVMADIRLLEDTPGVNRASIRVNQTQVTGDIRVGTNRPDLYAELNGRGLHIEYDRAPGTRAMEHARRILSNDPDAIVILKIIDF